MACVIFGEVLLSGRVAYGEHHDYTLFWSQTEARATDGALLFADTLKFIPQSASPEPIWTTRAVRCVMGRRVPAASLSDRLHTRLTELPSLTGGASELPNNCGAWAHTRRRIHQCCGGAPRGVGRARLALTGAPASHRRKT